MIRRVIKVLFFIPLALLTACTGPGGSTISYGVTPTLPPIDTRAPAAVETATFALG